MDQRVTHDTGIDLSFHEAQPPRMVDSNDFPPGESNRGDFGRVDLKPGDVTDPAYPWQVMAHDSPGGKARRDAVRKAKNDAVLKYVLVHARYWQQFQPPQFLPGDREETVSYTVGREQKKRKTVETGLEVTLGLKGKVLSAEVKASMKWTEQVEESFSESTTRTVTQQLHGNRWYFFWQTMDELTVYRVRKAEPGVLEEVSRVAAPSGVVMMDSFSMPDRAAPEGQRLGAAAVTLKKGQSTSFGGWVFASTKVYAKNLSDNDDGEATISWMNLGGKIVMTLSPDQTKHTQRYLPASFSVINSGVTDIQVWTA